MRMVGDLVMAVLVGLVVASGLGFVGWGITLGLPGGVSALGGAVAGVGFFIWRRQDPDAHRSPREDLERQLFGD